MNELVKVGNLPKEASQIPKFRDTVRNACADCAYRGEIAWTWARMVEFKGTTIDLFSRSRAGIYKNDCPELERLDCKLKVALTSQTAGAISFYLTQKEEEYQLRNHCPMRGRQILWLIYCYFAVSNSREAHVQIQDLLKVSYTKDTELPDFLYRLNTSLMRMFTRLDDENLRDMFLDQVRKSQAMKHVMEL